jgi:hypothetical protein
MCGEKTIYGLKEVDNETEINTDTLKISQNRISFIKYELTAIQREIQKVKGINISLDESEFCKHCSPFVEEPTLYLSINIGGESDTTKISDFDYMDVRLIHEFLAGSRVHEDGRGNEYPLIDYIERIKELLGIKE